MTFFGTERRKMMNLKTILKLSAIWLLFTLASCKSSVTLPGLTYKAPDVLSNPTKTVLVQETEASIPCSVIVQTPSTVKTHVTLAKDTIASVQVEPEKYEEMVLPQNTEVILPENTSIQTFNITPINVPEKTEIILPTGTEITIRKVNWYALLFYCLVILGAGWYYIKIRTKDVNNDGFEDTEKNINKKKRK
jgi:hypothetical protein